MYSKMTYSKVGLHIANNYKKTECAVFALRRANAKCCTECLLVSSLTLKLSPKVSHGGAWAMNAAAPQVFGRGLIPVRASRS